MSNKVFKGLAASVLKKAKIAKQKRLEYEIQSQKDYEKSEQAFKKNLEDLFTALRVFDGLPLIDYSGTSVLCVRKHEDGGPALYAIYSKPKREDQCLILIKPDIPLGACDNWEILGNDVPGDTRGLTITEVCERVAEYLETRVDIG